MLRMSPPASSRVAARCVDVDRVGRVRGPGLGEVLLPEPLAGRLVGVGEVRR